MLNLSEISAFVPDERLPAYSKVTARFRHPTRASAGSSDESTLTGDSVEIVFPFMLLPD